MLEPLHSMAVARAFAQSPCCTSPCTVYCCTTPCTVSLLHEPLHSLPFARAPAQSPFCTSPCTASLLHEPLHCLLLHEPLHSLPFARAPAQPPCCTSPCTVSLLHEPLHSLPVARAPAVSLLHEPKTAACMSCIKQQTLVQPSNGSSKTPASSPHILFSITTHSMLLKQPLPFARHHSQVEGRGGTVPGCTSPCTASMSSTRP